MSKKKKAKEVYEVRPINYCVLLEPIDVELKSKGGILLATDAKKDLEQNAYPKGKVLAIGELAFEDHLRSDLPLPLKEGDVVFYQRHAGMKLVDKYGDVNKKRLLIKDLDILAVEE